MYMDLYYDLCEAVGQPRKVPALMTVKGEE